MVLSERWNCGLCLLCSLWLFILSEIVIVFIQYSHNWGKKPKDFFNEKKKYSGGKIRNFCLD